MTRHAAPTLAHVVLPTLALAAAGVALRAGGADDWIADRLFDAGARVFPWRDDRLLELVGHDLARTLVVCIWFVTFAAALLAAKLELLAPRRSVLVAIAVAMAAGPLVVVILKDLTAFPCPWDLARYGGLSPEPVRWFVDPGSAGRCFPSGHSAAGFSLFGFYFAAAAVGSRRRAMRILGGVILTGLMFSAVRVVQGAHFASHALWSAAIDWAVTGAVFAWLVPASQRTVPGGRACPGRRR